MLALQRRHFIQATGGSLALLACGLSFAHDSQLGDLTLDHPYATPSAPGTLQGFAFLRQLRNSGPQADRLVGGHTPVASAVLIQQREGQAWRTVEALPIAARSEMPLRHDGPWRLKLQGLKAPLQVGDRFPLTLRFERSGAIEVRVWVQQPRAQPASRMEHPR
ncbi:MAG: copper chaperone PCu(A)C [Ideonella sp.]|nr:copper chaperone PCu(A)C [Ideonella sp.]